MHHRPPFGGHNAEIHRSPLVSARDLTWGKVGDWGQRIRTKWRLSSASDRSRQAKIKIIRIGERWIFFFNPEILIPDLRCTISDFTKIGSCRNVPEEKFEVRFEKRMTKWLLSLQLLTTDYWLLTADAMFKLIAFDEAQYVYRDVIRDIRFLRYLLVTISLLHSRRNQSTTGASGWSALTGVSSELFISF